MVLSWLRDTLANPAQPKVGANLMYDVGWLRHEGVTVAGELVDVQYAEALLDERAEVALEVLAQHHEYGAVVELYRAADICVVTSLHDGMNLVCKEFVAENTKLQASDDPDLSTRPGCSACAGWPSSAGKSSVAVSRSFE